MRSQSLKIRDVAVHQPVTARVGRVDRHLRPRMHDEHVGCLVVVEQNDGSEFPVGMLTDRDIAIEVVAFGLDPATMTAGDVMSERPAVVEEDDDLLDALAHMRERGVRRLPGRAARRRAGRNARARQPARGARRGDRRRRRRDAGAAHAGNCGCGPDGTRTRRSGPMAASNARIAAVFEEIADLLEVQGENPFRIRAYRNAARTVNQQGPAFAERAARGEELGKIVRDRRRPRRQDPRDRAHGQLRAAAATAARRAPRHGLAAADPRPGAEARAGAVGAARRPHARAAAATPRRADACSALRGFGPKTTAHVLRALATDRSKKERVPLAIAQREATAVLDHMRRAPGIADVVVAGSIRRQRPTVGDIDLLAVGDRRRRDRAPLRRLSPLPRDARPGRDQGQRRARQRIAGRPARGSGRRASAPRCSISPVRRRSTSSCASARSTWG